MHAARLGRGDVLLFGAALLGTALAARSAALGGPLGLIPLAGLLFFFTLVALTIVAPHVLVAATIPIFAAVPVGKQLFLPSIGPVKDAIVLAAIAGTCLAVVVRQRTGERTAADTWVVAAALAVLALYVINLGGGFATGAYDIAWAQGVRLAAEPIFLLLIGLFARDPRRTLDWALKSLVATAVVVAIYGLWQQAIGPSALVGMGYEWNYDVRLWNGHLRSFGTLDDPFAYAAFLLLGLAALLYRRRAGLWPMAAGTVLLAGLAVSFVRTAIVIALALAALWLSQRSLGGVAVLVLAASVAAGVAFLASSVDASEQRTVRAGENTYLSINGRTDVWRTVVGERSDWLLGRGVGEVGTAADRATFAVFATGREAASQEGTAIDNGYLAAVADVGIVGLGVLLALFARIAVLALRAIKLGVEAGWVAAGALTVILLDGVTRASFNGFPTAFVSMLVIGLALAAAAEESREPRLARA
jgi:hypothetical protein